MQSPETATMSTFAKGTFDFARYAAARPTYPRQLYDFVFKYHERSRGAKWDLAVDLGCGTGPSSEGHLTDSLGSPSTQAKLRSS